MKNLTLCVSVGLAFCAWNASAEEAASKDVSGPERTAIESEYKVDDARVQGLRDQKLGYGEISKVLGLAETMPGGINDDNVKAIVAERQGPPVKGWGQIAKAHNVTMGSLNRRDKSVKAAARATEKLQKAQRPEKAPHPAHVDKIEKADKIEKSEKAEHPKH